MKRYSVAKARERLADVLNDADRNGSVLIERGDVRYEVRVRRTPKRRATRRSVIESVDPSIADGQWQWRWTDRGVRFHPRRRT